MWRQLRRVLIVFGLVMLMFGLSWCWAQWTDDVVCELNYRRISVGMTLEDVRAILGAETRTCYILDDGQMIGIWEGRNKAITVGFGAEFSPRPGAVVRDKKIDDENAVMRWARWMGEQAVDAYDRVTSIGSNAQPVTQVVR